MKVESVNGPLTGWLTSSGRSERKGKWNSISQQFVTRPILFGRVVVWGWFLCVKWNRHKKAMCRRWGFKRWPKFVQEFRVTNKICNFFSHGASTCAKLHLNFYLMDRRRPLFNGIKFNVRISSHSSSLSSIADEIEPEPDMATDSINYS